MCVPRRHSIAEERPRITAARCCLTPRPPSHPTPCGWPQAGQHASATSCCSAKLLAAPSAAPARSTVTAASACSASCCGLLLDAGACAEPEQLGRYCNSASTSAGARNPAHTCRAQSAPHPCPERMHGTSMRGCTHLVPAAALCMRRSGCPRSRHAPCLHAEQCRERLDRGRGTLQLQCHGLCMLPSCCSGPRTRQPIMCVHAQLLASVQPRGTRDEYRQHDSHIEEHAFAPCGRFSGGRTVQCPGPPPSPPGCTDLHRVNRCETTSTPEYWAGRVVKHIDARWQGHSVNVQRVAVR